MTTNVAIACQGGGSHTAFTAGVLRTLLPWLDDSDDCRLVGLSGTSGGALSALVGWYGYVAEDGDRAAQRLADLWADIAVRTPADRLANGWLVWANSLQYSPFPTATLSPYQLPFSGATREQFLSTVRSHVDFDRLPELAARPDSPRLVVGTVDVNAGRFETFTERTITPDAILASAAVPSLFEAVEIDGHYHWDGLFSQNPPVYDLMHTDPERKPDELWVVQVNPQTRDDEPRTPQEIADRRNELSGNISLNQELRFIETVNEWVDRGHLPDGHYTHTEIRRLILGESLDYASKLDRSERFIRELMATGAADAEAFLADTTVGEHAHAGRQDDAH